MDKRGSDVGANFKLTLNAPYHSVSRTNHNAASMAVYLDTFSNHLRYQDTGHLSFNFARVRVWTSYKPFCLSTSVVRTNQSRKRKKETTRNLRGRLIVVEKLKLS